MRRTVLIVDDHADFLSAARALLQAEGFEVVGEASSGLEALGVDDRLRPEVVLLDVRLPDLDGIAVAERLASLDESPAVVLVSSRDASAYGARLRAVPACGFLAKSELSGDALRQLLDT